MKTVSFIFAFFLLPFWFGSAIDDADTCNKCIADENCQYCTEGTSLTNGTNTVSTYECLCDIDFDAYSGFCYDTEEQCNFWNDLEDVAKTIGRTIMVVLIIIIIGVVAGIAGCVYCCCINKKN